MSEPFIAHSVPSSHNFIPPAIADYDNDGDPDLPWAENLGNWDFRYVSAIDDLIEGVGYAVTIRRNMQSQQSPSQRYLGVRGARSYLAFHGVQALDFDADGQQDFLALPYDQPGVPILLFRNLGNWQFEFSRQDFFQNLLGWNPTTTWQSETTIWGDLTGDGLNDLYLAYNTYKEPFQSIFLRNTGSAFVEEAMSRGVGVPNLSISLRPEGAAAADIDEDGDLDFYVAHHLFINDGTGNYTDMRAAYGLPVTFDEGAAFVDYNNDGLLDLYLRSPNTTNVLFRNTGSGFVNTSINSGLTCLMQNLPFYEGDAWADFDRDGDLDLLITFDWQLPQYALFLNQGNGSFHLGYIGNRFIDLPATADFDNDGDMDIATVLNEVNENRLPAPVGARNLSVIPVDTNEKPSEMGTVIRLRNHCTSYVQTQVTGTNSVYLAHGEYAAHFAIPYACAHQIEITFPKKGAQPQQTLLIPFNPVTEGSLRIMVSRSGYSKRPYATFMYYFPVIQKGQ